MSSLESVPNQLIAALPARERSDVLERCQTVELTFGEIIVQPNQPIRHVYFPLTGYVSTLAVVNQHTSLELGLIGNEGMFGASLVLGVNFSPFRATVQGTGTALRMTASDFVSAIDQSHVFRQLLYRYVYVLFSQLAQTAACTCFHVIEARLARWLLMTHDRAHANHFRLTHELLSDMLGVRRAGISTAAADLQSRELIRYNRGKVIVLDRKGLEAVSCECYAVSEKMYASGFA